MPYPTYSVNGTPMADALGRWHEHAEMSVFPSHPGLRSSALSIMGVGGEYSLPQAPIEPQDFVLHMVVNAVADNGARPATYAERLVALNANVQQLMRVLRVATMTQGGVTNITRYLSATQAVTANGRLEASANVEFDPGADWLEMKFVFRLPFGVWRGTTFVNEKLNAAASATRYVDGLKKSTAPIDGPFVTLVGPLTSLQVTNQFGNGFRYARALAAGQAVNINTQRWSATEPYPVEAGAENLTVPNQPYYQSPHLSTVGVASGTALTLLPDHTGVPVRFTGTGRDGNTAMHIHTTEAFL